ncbi:hypothetical protein C0033_11200 [Clostridium sp. chh4-2]|uniref:hypothetical protein n=1 Tax=Clostridium sp. chh4-2 TaxID=2067550 RepID=UPI000CCF8606|nr:hypothetical protein [Clostridium sp. chh4-2]PNV61809.1 hypothetical protein C0033_11200 [Clostridium sp. chh4-2]
MKINSKKNYPSHIFIFFIMLLFAASFTMNVFFCSNYNLYKLIDEATVTETKVISEDIISNEDCDDTAHLNVSFLSENNSHTETITNNISPISIITAIPKGFSILLFLIITFLYFFSALFRLLPDKWTLINQKVRLDD